MENSYSNLKTYSKRLEPNLKNPATFGDSSTEPPVTAARLDYEGSITIDPLLMQAAGIVPFQLLHINNLSNAAHWETYAISWTEGAGEICLNGCPARLFHPGDKVIILCLEQLPRIAKGLSFKEN